MSAKQKLHTVRFEMVLTKEQNESWQALANSQRISKAELIRRAMADFSIVTVPQVNWKCYWLLLEISQKINQIAAVQNSAIANGSISPPVNPITFKELETAISQLRTYLTLGIDPSSDEVKNSDDWQD